MHQLIYEILVYIAKAGHFTVYSAVAPLAGLDMGNPE